MPPIDAIIETFNTVDRDLRLELLLDYAKRLPAVPDELDRTADDARVHECMTAVWLWVERANGAVRVYAKVADEAPTVQGDLSVIVHGYEGATADELAGVPGDLADRLGIGEAVGMRRSVGLHHVTERVRREARRLVEVPGEAGPDDPGGGAR